jgi:hypothetical protein
MDTVMSITRPLMSLLLLALLFSCRSTARSAITGTGLVPADFECPPTSGQRYRGDFVQSLVDGDEDSVTIFACAFLRNEVAIDRRSLLDDRKLPNSMILRVPTGSHYYQFSPLLISDAAACLLSVKYSMPTSAILQRKQELGSLCQGCDICSSGVTPVDTRVRKEVREYWLERLSADTRH